MPETTTTRIERLAELVVRVGANVQPGQDVHISGLVEHAPIARAVAERAYLAGARRVVVAYEDLQVRRSAVRHAPAEALGSAYRYERERLLEWGELGTALIRLTGDPDAAILAGVDPVRVAALPSRELSLIQQELISTGRIPWTIAAAPNEGWAREVFGAPDVERLWDAVAVALGLDEPDPVGAWRTRLAALQARRDTLTRLGADAIRFRGPGTDLTIGLLPGGRWLSASMTTPSGIEFVPNLPTEEVFTSPDRRRADGVLRATAPLVVPQAGVVVRGLRFRFEAGRIVDVEADEGADLVRAQLARDPQASSLGEVSMVDGSSLVRRAGVTFHDTLFDENAGCHIAYGAAFPTVLPGGEDMTAEERLAAGLNDCPVHTDVVVGGPEVDVDAILRDGTIVPVIAHDAWMLPASDPVATQRR
jgi:aminopeptidase